MATVLLPNRVGSTIQSTEAIYYPESDGEPVGETDFHISVIFYLRSALRFLFRQTNDIYVAGNMLFYYIEGNPRAFKVPDIFVVKGITKQDRRTYKLWEEGAIPCTIFEITSASTRSEDTSVKKQLYESWGVKEYFLYDPLGEYLKPRFQGFRLVRGRYESIFPERDRSIISHELGAILRPEETLLRVVEQSTGIHVPEMGEAAEIAEELLQFAAAETQRADTEAKRAEVETVRADSEAQRAEAEAQRAETEAQRATVLEAELIRVRAEMAEMQRKLKQQ